MVGTLRFAHPFFPFPVVIFIALLMCVEQPAMSFCDSDDFAEVISCIAAVLLSPSGIFITAASALAMLSSVQPDAFDFAKAGIDVIAMATTAAQTILIIMLVPPMNCGGVAEQEERLIGTSVPFAEQGDNRLSQEPYRRAAVNAAIYSAGLNRHPC
jgi:hypothetical protein